MLSASSSISFSQSATCSSMWRSSSGSSPSSAWTLSSRSNSLTAYHRRNRGSTLPWMDSSMWAMACSTLPVKTWGSSPTLPSLAAWTASSAAWRLPSPFRALISMARQPSSWLSRFRVDLVAVFAHQVDHVHRHDHRDAQLDQLGGQVELRSMLVPSMMSGWRRAFPPPGSRGPPLPPACRARGNRCRAGPG